MRYHVQSDNAALALGMLPREIVPLWGTRKTIANVGGIEKEESRGAVLPLAPISVYHGIEEEEFPLLSCPCLQCAFTQCKEAGRLCKMHSASHTITS